MSDAISRFRDYAVANARAAYKGGIPRLVCEVETPPRVAAAAAGCGYTSSTMSIEAVFTRRLAGGEHIDIVTGLKVYAGKSLTASNLVGHFQYDDDGDWWPESVHQRFATDGARKSWNMLQPKITRVVERFLDQQAWL